MQKRQKKLVKNARRRRTRREKEKVLKINSVSKSVLPNMAVFPINTFKISWGHTIQEIEKTKNKKQRIAVSPLIQYSWIHFIEKSDFMNRARPEQELKENGGQFFCFLFFKFLFHLEKKKKTKIYWYLVTPFVRIKNFFFCIKPHPFLFVDTLLLHLHYNWSHNCSVFRKHLSNWKFEKKHIKNRSLQKKKKKGKQCRPRSFVVNLTISQQSFWAAKQTKGKKVKTKKVKIKGFFLTNRAWTELHSRIAYKSFYCFHCFYRYKYSNIDQNLECNSPHETKNKSIHLLYVNNGM